MPEYKNAACKNCNKKIEYVDYPGFKDPYWRHQAANMKCSTPIPR